VNRRVLLAGVGGALVVLLLWYFLLWSPRGDAIADAKEREDAADNALQELQAERQRLEDLRNNEAATRARIEQLRQSIPDEPNLAQFILDANDAANQSGIDFLSIAPTPPAASSAAPVPDPNAPANAQAAAPPAEISLTISITGGYFQVLDFVNRLNRLTRIVVIDGLSVGAGEGGALSVQLTGRMFVTSVPAGTAAPGATGGTPAGVTTTTTAPAGATTTTVGGATTTTAPAGAPTTVAP
jgi:Tfp pilus assembly protein PilO